MFPSSGFFKSSTCPHNEDTPCKRPYCHFHHISSKKKYGVTANSDKTAINNAVKSSTSQFTEVTSGRNNDDKLVPTADNTIDPSTLLNQVLQEAVKKALSENPLLSETFNTNDLISHVNANSILKNVVKNIPSKCETAKKQQKLYLPPPGIPSYNPTPISQLKQKLESSNEYTPASIATGANYSGIVDNLVDEADFSPVEDDEQSRSDFDMLEQVLAERSCTSHSLKAFNDKKQRFKRERSLHTTKVSSKVQAVEELNMKSKCNDNEDKLCDDSFLPPSPVFKSSADIPSYSGFVAPLTDVRRNIENMSDSSENEISTISNPNNINIPKKIIKPQSHSMLPQIAHLSRPLAKDCIPIVKVAPSVPLAFSAVEELLQKLDGTNEAEITKSKTDIRECKTEVAASINKTKFSKSTNENAKTFVSRDSEEISVKHLELDPKKSNILVVKEKVCVSKRLRDKRRHDSSDESLNRKQRRSKSKNRSHSKHSKKRKKSRTSESSSSADESDCSVELDRHRRKKHKKHSKHKKSNKRMKKSRRKRKHRHSRHSSTDSSKANSDEECEDSPLPVALCDIKAEKDDTDDVTIVESVPSSSVKKEAEKKLLTNKEDELLTKELSVQTNSVKSSKVNSKTNSPDCLVTGNKNVSLFDMVALHLKEEKSGNEPPSIIAKSEQQLINPNKSSNVKESAFEELRKCIIASNNTFPSQLSSNDVSYHNPVMMQEGTINNTNVEGSVANLQKSANTRTKECHSELNKNYSSSTCTHSSSKGGRSMSDSCSISASSKHNHSSKSKNSHSSTSKIKDSAEKHHSSSKSHSLVNNLHSSSSKESHTSNKHSSSSSKHTSSSNNQSSSSNNQSISSNKHASSSSKHNSSSVKHNSSSTKPASSATKPASSSIKHSTSSIKHSTSSIKHSSSSIKHPTSSKHSSSSSKHSSSSSKHSSSSSKHSNSSKKIIPFDKYNSSLKDSHVYSDNDKSKTNITASNIDTTEKSMQESSDSSNLKNVPFPDFGDLLSTADTAPSVEKRRKRNLDQKEFRKRLEDKSSGRKSVDELAISPDIGSPMPDLSVLDEIDEEDWDQLLENNDKTDKAKINLSSSEDMISLDQIDYVLYDNPDTTFDSDDANDPKVLQECFQLFSSYNPDEIEHQNLKPKKSVSRPEDLNETADVPVRYQRNARTGATGNLLATGKAPKRIMRKTPAEVMLERYNKLKEEEAVLQKKLSEHRSCLERTIGKNRTLSSSRVTSSSLSSPSISSSSGSSISRIASSDQYGVSSTGVTGGKKRIARAPSNVAALMNSKSKLLEFRRPSSETVAQSSAKKEIETIATTNAKGTKRIAHFPTTNEALERPVIVSNGRSKVPQNIRQRYLNTFIEETVKFCDSTKLAYEFAVAEENICHDKASTRMVYLNLAVNTVKRLRSQNVSESAQDAVRLSKSSSCSSMDITEGCTTPGNKFTHPVNPNHKTMTHFSVMAYGGQKGSWSIESHKKVANINLDTAVTGSNFYKYLKKYIMSTKYLDDNGYPSPDPTDKGKAVIKKTNWRKKINPSMFERICARCSVSYKVDDYGVPLLHQTCVYHWGRMYKTRGRSGFETKYSCCQSDNSADGCCLADVHVSDNYNPDCLRGFVSTLEKSNAQREVYALDCEMCYTTEGNELTRITVINSSRETVYETLVLPDNPIIDYNTRFSGISAEDMKNVTVSLRDVQAALLTKFSSKTILMGHSLESDFLALKLMHNRVVDTSIVFPHKLGPPYKRALRNLASELLKKLIQNDVGGHDSAEDAITCIELMQWKVKEDLKLTGIGK